MPRLYSKDDVLAMLRRRAAALGSHRALATALRVTPPYLSDVFHGKREPGPTVLRRLGLRRVVMFARAKEARR